MYKNASCSKLPSPSAARYSRTSNSEILIYGQQKLTLDDLKGRKRVCEFTVMMRRLENRLRRWSGAKGWWPESARIIPRDSLVGTVLPPPADT